MSHNPYANHHPVGGRPWTADEDQIVISMREDGHTTEEISASHRIDRTLDAIKCRISYLKLPRLIARRIPRKRAVYRIQHDTYTTPTVPPEVWEDRNRRLMADTQRSVTSSICKDPPPGYSALERRA